VSGRPRRWRCTPRIQPTKPTDRSRTATIGRPAPVTSPRPTVVVVVGSGIGDDGTVVAVAVTT